MSNHTSTGLIVVACGRGPAIRLARAWASRGRQVALLSDTPVDTTPGLTPIPCSFASGAEVQDAMARAAALVGGLHEVVLSVLPAAALNVAEVATMAPQTWEVAHDTFKPALYGVQAVALLADGPCALTLIGPNVSLIGAAGLVPLCTGVEAQRTLVKASARQLGTRGIRVNWVAIGSMEFDADFGDVALPAVPELGPPPPALGRRLDIVEDVLPAIEFLGSPAARGITGHTMNLDGGDWMLP